MKKHSLILVAILSIAASSSTAGAQQSAAKPSAPARQQPAFSANAAAERIPNLDALKQQLKQYHDCTCKCGCYARDIDGQADRAIAFLRRRVAHREAQQKTASTQKLAMVFDIDETSLSNYPEFLKADFAYDSKAFDAWAQTAQAPAISGSLRIYKEAQRLGVSVFFITGRPESERAATERNLRLQGFQVWQQLTLRPSSTDSESTSAYKSAARARIVAEGYRIVLNVGDQWSDLKGSPEAEFSVKYPDPYYLIP